MDSNTIPSVKIEVFIPVAYVNALRDALHEAGAGRVGNYDHCLSITQVRGYWRPLDGAEPYDGEVGTISEGLECKIEVRCATESVPVALKAIKQVHPYDEPVINVVPLLNHLFDQ